MNIHAFKRCISCVLSLLACVFALLIFNFNTSMAFAATETVAIYDYEYISNSQLNEYKNNLFEADTFYNEGYFLNYRFYMPDDMSESVPLIIALHGGGERGRITIPSLIMPLSALLSRTKTVNFTALWLSHPSAPKRIITTAG